MYPPYEGEDLMLIYPNQYLMQLARFPIDVIIVGL